MKLTNKKGLSDCWVKAAENDQYDKAGDYSATTLIGPPKIHFLKLLYDDKIREDVSDRIWSMFGSAIHEILNLATEGEASLHSEKRLLFPFLNRQVSMKPDRVEPIGDGDYALKDFKVTSVYVWAKPVKFTWEAQTNIYAYGLRKFKDINVTEIYIELLLRDWSRGDMLKKKTLSYNNNYDGSTSTPGYPDANVQQMPVRVWSDEEVENYLAERVGLFKACEGLKPDELPPCSEMERWADAGQFIVKSIKKDGSVSQKATPGGKFDTRPEAEEFVAEKQRKDKKKEKTRYQIEYREAKSRRCEFYCSVNRWCQQYNNEINPDF